LHVKTETDITSNLMQENTIENGRLLPLPANPNKVNKNLIIIYWQHAAPHYKIKIEK